MSNSLGLAGGGDGARGLSLLLRADGRLINLGGKATVKVMPGDRLRLLTPGWMFWWYYYWNKISVSNAGFFFFNYKIHAGGGGYGTALPSEYIDGDY